MFGLLPRRREYVNVVPEEIQLEETLTNLEISRAQLVDLAILVGTDFNPGVKGIGPKTALKLLKKHNNLEAIIKEKEIEIADYQKIRDIFLDPDVTLKYEIKLSEIKESSILKLLVDDYEFSENRVKSALDKVQVVRKERAQSKLEKWF
jgi:flap endonuclease-1